MTAQTALKKIQAIQRQLNRSKDRYKNYFYYPNEGYMRLMVADIGERLVVEYYGHCHSDEKSWELVQKVLVDPKVAPFIAVLRFSGPDEGANGNREWDFSVLLDHSKTFFPALVSLEIQTTQTQMHNKITVCEDQLVPLLKLFPKVRELVIPQCPTPDFFSLKFKHLSGLTLGMSFQTHQFIRHLANSRNLPALTKIDFSDSAAFTLKTKPSAGWGATAFEDYEYLFNSAFFNQVGVFFIRNAQLTKAQFQTLEKRRPDCQFAAMLEAPHAYVSSWDSGPFTYRHLLLKTQRAAK